MKQQGSLLRRFPNNLKGPKFEGCLTVLDSILASYLNRLDSGTVSSFVGCNPVSWILPRDDGVMEQGQMCQKRIQYEVGKLSSTLRKTGFEVDNNRSRLAGLHCRVLRFALCVPAFPVQRWHLHEPRRDIRNSVTNNFQLMLFVSSQRPILAKLKKQSILNNSYHFRFAISERMMVDSHQLER